MGWTCPKNGLHIVSHSPSRVDFVDFGTFFLLQLLINKTEAAVMA
jgi:hypothetical protein